MTNTEKKLTKREMFTMLLAIEEVGANEDLVNFINHEIELLDKKAGKASKSQKENEGIKARLVEELVAIGKAVTVTEFIKASEYAQENEFSNQKITSLFSQLEKAKEIQKVVLKGKSYYSA